jgi:CubicO group peptidase (beta-lactamase class C family)
MTPNLAPGRRYLRLILATLIALCGWAFLVFAALDQGLFRLPIAEQGESTQFLAAAGDIAEKRNRGNLALVLIEGEDEVGSFAISEGQPVGRDTLFQTASLGKWLTAWGVMALVEEGRIDLDAPVSTYLSRWRLPDSEFDEDGVTVRRLLSHTSGLGDGLGYDGFSSPGDVQTLEASLSRAADASPRKSGEVRLDGEPGARWQYSGGGYTLLQLVVEEVSGQSFARYMEEAVFDPLGMKRTTFDHDRAVSLGVAENFSPDGTRQPFRRFTALAASGLFTTAEDLATFLKAQGPNGSGAVLSPEARRLIASPHASRLGADIWGLGAMLYAPDNRGGFIIGHDGQNGPAINAAARLDPASGDGIVVLSTGSDLLATKLAGEWVFWKTGNVDTLDFAAGIPAALAWLAGGWVAILVAAVMAGFRLRRRSKAHRANQYASGEYPCTQ